MKEELCPDHECHEQGMCTDPDGCILKRQACVFNPDVLEEKLAEINKVNHQRPAQESPPVQLK